MKGEAARYSVHIVTIRREIGTVGCVAWGTMAGSFSPVMKESLERSNISCGRSADHSSSWTPRRPWFSLFNFSVI